MQQWVKLFVLFSSHWGRPKVIRLDENAAGGRLLSLATEGRDIWETTCWIKFTTLSIPKFTSLALLPPTNINEYKYVSVP